MPEQLDSAVCNICGGPTDLDIDRYTNGRGKPVHEQCYVKQILEDGHRLPQPA